MRGSRRGEPIVNERAEGEDMELVLSEQEDGGEDVALEHLEHLDGGEDAGNMETEHSNKISTKTNIKIEKCSTWRDACSKTS